ncbi:hypothetical protein Csa_023723, partial [Cucumis sativus]
GRWEMGDGRWEMGDGVGAETEEIYAFVYGLRLAIREMGFVGFPLEYCDALGLSSNEDVGYAHISVSGIQNIKGSGH